MTLVSVVIPTIGRNSLTERTLPSLAAQTHPDVEIVVEGDQLARADYPADPQAFWCAKGCAARNAGIERATGEWILPLDDDDALYPWAITALLAASDDADVVYGRAYIEGAGLLGSAPPQASGFCLGAVMFRASLAARFDPDCWRRGLPGDWDLWSRLIEQGARWRFVDQIVLHYFPAEKVPQVDAA